MTTELLRRRVCTGAPGVVGLFLLLVLGCAKADLPAAKPIPVMVATAEIRPVPYTVDASGTVEPLARVNVEAQVSGQLLRIGFKEGDNVARGQSLFEIDPAPFQAALRQAQAVLARDRAQLGTAERDAERYASLVKQEYVTPQQYEAAQANAAALRATILADSAAVENARINLERATVRAPIAGRAGNLMLREGNLVKGPGNVLVTINQISPILVRFPIPGTGLGEIQRQTPEDVLVTAQVPGGVREAGHLAFVDNAVDTSTGTILLKGVFLNADGGLWPGQFVQVRMQLYVEQNALVIPSAAVLSGQQGTSVFVIDSAHTVSPRTVQVARSTDSLAVIASGLQEGEQVVTNGQLRLVPGAHVEIKDAAARVAKAAP